MRIRIGELENRQVIQEHQAGSQNCAEPEEHAQYESEAQKRETPFIKKIRERQKRGCGQPLVKAGQGFGALQITGRRPGRVKHFGDSGPKEHPPQGDAEKKQRHSLPLRHNFVLVY